MQQSNLFIRPEKRLLPQNVCQPHHSFIDLVSHSTPHIWTSPGMSKREPEKLLIKKRVSFWNIKA